MAELVPERPSKPTPLKNSVKIGTEFSPKLIAPIDVFQFEEGDEFIIPTTFEIFTVKIGGKLAEYIAVDMKNGEKKQLFPSVFVRPRTIYNEDLISTGKRIFPKGTASDLVRKEGDLQKGMELLKGKTLRVTKINYIPTLRSDGNATMTVAIPTIDIIE